MAFLEEWFYHLVLSTHLSVASTGRINQLLQSAVSYLIVWNWRQWEYVIVQTGHSWETLSYQMKEKSVRREREGGSWGWDWSRLLSTEHSGEYRGQQVILDNSVLMVTFMTEAQCGIKTEKQTLDCKLK